MRRTGVRSVPWLVMVVVALAAGVAAPGRAQHAALPTEPADLALQQIAALRSHDFASAYALGSGELRRHFSRGEFEWMVKRAHPEVASSSSAVVVRTHESGGYVYVTLRVLGRNGKYVEALYEMVREGEAWKVNALSSRPGDSTL